MHRPPHPQSTRPDPTKLSGVHRKLRRAKKPGWNDTQHDLNEYRASAQELLEKKLRLMSKEQLMRLAGLTPPLTQRAVSSQQGNIEGMEVGIEESSGEDKENARPESSAVNTARPIKLHPAKPAATTATPSALTAARPSSAAVQVSVQPVVTAAPRVTNGSPDATPSTTPPAQPTTSLGYRTVLRAEAALSPVLEGSIEVELDAEAHADTLSQPPAARVQQQEADDSETQQLIARIDSLTAASPAATQPPIELTPDKRAQLVVQEVAARMRQLADTPPQLPSSFSPPPLPPLTPPHLTLPPHTAIEPSTPSIHHRLFLLLKQVASHLETLTTRQSLDATERTSLVQQLDEKSRLIVQLQSRVQSLEGGVMLVQRQLLAVQRGYDEQLAGMMSSLARLEQRQAPAAAADEADTTQPTVRTDSDGKQGTFAVPPPFVSSQVRSTNELSQQQLVSPSSRRHRAVPTTAMLHTPPRSPFTFSPIKRPASSASFLASPTPPRTGRSPRRIIARWDELSNLEHRLQAASNTANPPADQPYQHTALGGHSERGVEAVEAVVGRTDEQHAMAGLSSSSSSSSSSVSAKLSGRRSAGWPQHSAGWTVHMR